MMYSKMRRKRRLAWGEGIVSGATMSTNGFVTSTLVLWKKATFSGVRSCCIVLMTVWSSWVSL